jgi:CubicO group peptidase (beta-lactamase class C family)
VVSVTFTVTTPLHGQPPAATRVWGFVAVLCAMAACSAPVPQGPPDDRVCAGSVCVSPSVMTGRVRGLLDGQVVGYFALVGDDVAVGGAARKQTDPPGQPMGVDVVANTASVGKMFTTVVVLKALAERGLGPDAAIGPYLPPDWVRGPNTESITFRELLTHRSGFRLDNAEVFASDAAAREQIAAGVTAADKGTPAYNNINFSIMRDLLPRLDRAAHGSPESWFLDRVQRDVFDPVGVHGARCATPAAPMLYYPPLATPPVPGRYLPSGLQHAHRVAGS